MLNRRKARVAEGRGGLGHIVTPADRLARITHDPQHVCERQLAGCGCFLSHFVICTADSLGAASARTFSTVSVNRAIARAIENRGPYNSESGSSVPQYGTVAERGVGADAFEITEFGT
jgi:hypothetical protein